jgi:SAM-dependent methyltransferase
MKSLNRKILSILVCQNCKSQLNYIGTDLTCKKCGFCLPVKDGVVDFLGTEKADLYKGADPNDLNFQKEQMSNSTIFAKTYNLSSNIISCDYKPFNQIKVFLNDIANDKVLVELGSGNRRLRDDCINVDIFPFENVDILADIMKTPFADNTVDYVIIDAVLEHVPNPFAVVDELYRILKYGGKAFCVVPFIHPYHGYPKNYFNISRDGLLYLFREFKECIVETYRGPTSAIINLMAEYLALAFLNNEKGLLYAMLRGGALLPIFIFKYLDRLWNPRGPALRISNALCAIVTK